MPAGAASTRPVNAPRGSAAIRERVSGRRGRAAGRGEGRRRGWESERRSRTTPREGSPFPRRTGHLMTAPETWLPIAEAAVYSGCSVKALRRRVERGTVVSERRENGRRYVLISSLPPREHAPPRPAGNTPAIPPQQAVGELLARLESLAVENGKLRALTEVAESTEKRLADELVEVRTRLQAAEQRLARRRWWRRS